LADIAQHIDGSANLAATVQVYFEIILEPVGTLVQWGNSTAHTIVAHARMAVGVIVAALIDQASLGAGRPTAVNITFLAIAETIKTADAVPGITPLAHAVGVSHARRRAGTLGAGWTATVNICFKPVVQAILTAGARPTR
jgi:hypothetical protein